MSEIEVRLIISSLQQYGLYQCAEERTNLLAVSSAQILQAAADNCIKCIAPVKNKHNKTTKHD